MNFEQKEIKIADEYAKVIIGQKQPIQANFEPLYLFSVSPASAFGGLFWKELNHIEILDDSTETHYDLVFGYFRSILCTSSTMKLATSSLSLFRLKKR